jgi:MSHA biogenesis protein MshN
LAASEATPKPAEQSTAIQQVAQPEVAATRKDTEVIQAAAKPAGIAVTGKNAAHEVAKAPNEDTPKTHASREPSFKVVSTLQQSDNLYLQAISLMQQSRDAEAQDALTKAIRANPSNHNARQLSAILLADAGRNKEAEALLQDGLNISPGHSDFSIKLARLQFADGDKEKALATMQQGLPKAGKDPEYNAFYAALLQNQGRHDEAVQHYITALRSNPSNPNWLIGVGISLKAIGKKSDAAEAFQRAINTGELSTKVAQYAAQQLKQIRP